VRSGPARISPHTYPIAATATAPAYDFEPEAQPKAKSEPVRPARGGQQWLFAPAWSDPRVIPFDSLTSEKERESIRARAAEMVRPAASKPKTARAQGSRTAKQGTSDQQDLDFFAPEPVMVQGPVPGILCDAPVAPPSVRMRAAMVDALVIIVACAAGAAFFRYLAGPVTLDQRAAAWCMAGFATIALFYKVLWTFAGADTIGMQAAGLRLVDFDGRVPSPAQRHQRLAGELVSTLAAGVGLVWAFVDQERLTWHDHMSGTFPTLTEPGE